MSKRFIIPNIGTLCETYRAQLIYVKGNSEYIEYLINKNGEKYPSAFNFYEMLFSPHVEKWRSTLMLLSPVKYEADRLFLRSELLEKHKEQLIFADKILPIVKNFNFNEKTIVDNLTSKYGVFLSLCLKNPDKHIVPTLIEDFVWHSHMIDHNNYVNMTKEMFGKILDHRTDIDLKKSTVETQSIREKFIKSLQTDLTLTTAATIGMGGFAVGSVLSNIGNNNETNKDAKKGETSSSCGSSSCGIDLFGLGPSGIYNPINPWNNINPISPYYRFSHPYPFSEFSGHSNSSEASISDSGDSPSSISDSGDSSICGSSSCGSSCGGGGD